MTDNRGLAVLFDLDGTLLDSAPDLAGAINDMRHEDGLEPVPVAQLAPYASMGGRGLLGRGYDLTPTDNGYTEAYDRFISRYRARMTRDSRLYDGIESLLRQLQKAGQAWGIVTNKAEGLALPLVEHFAFMPTPRCVIGGDTAGVPKPDPAPMLLACQRIDRAPSQCLFVGDSIRDIQAGQAVGMPTIAAAYGYITDDDDVHTWGADAIAHDAADLWAAIQKLQGS